MRQFSFGGPDAEGRESALSALLRLARRRDSLTLIGLFPRASREERLRVFDRLNALVPAPASVRRESIDEWRIGTTDPWWPPVLDASGVRAIKKGKGARFPAR